MASTGSLPASPRSSKGPGHLPLDFPRRIVCNWLFMNKPNITHVYKESSDHSTGYMDPGYLCNHYIASQAI